MNFEFSTANRIIFEVGGIHRLPEIASPLGKRCLVVTGQKTQGLVDVEGLLEPAGIKITSFIVKHEPDINLILNGLALMNEFKCDFIIATGGGSIIDAGKALAILSTNPGNPIDYFEIIGNGKKFMNASLPFIAVPTTSGTGSEVTRNSVIKIPDYKVKVSLRDEQMLPRIALIDPALTLSLPPEITANTGMDAICQVIEPFVSKKANPVTDAFCREGITLGARYILRAFKHSDDLDARTKMALASLMGGLALANAGLGAVHGFAGPIGGMSSAPHGAICARLLPFVAEANIKAMIDREPNNAALGRYLEIARLLTEKNGPSFDDLTSWLKKLIDDLEIKPLSAYSITIENIPEIIEKSEKARSMKGNPIILSYDEMAWILEQAI